MSGWHKRLGATTILLAFLTAGCATTGRIPEIRHATVAPPTLQPGQTALITVEIHDIHQIVHRVEGTLADYPDRAFKLRDDGLAPDIEAADGVWTMEVAVPFTASPGDYAIRFTAFDSDGNVIVVPGENGQGEDLAADISVAITYPTEGE